MQRLDTLVSLDGNMGTDKEPQELTQTEQLQLQEHSQSQDLLKHHMRSLLFLLTYTELKVMLQMKTLN